jgi:hypothetical protein
MRAVHYLVLLLILIPTLILAGCGGSGVKFAPRPNGSFNNSSLRGSYAFSFTGVNQFGFLSVAGSLQADGNGNFTSGVEDVNSGNGVFTNISVAGNYTVGADGRGTATLASSVATISLDFVVISSQHALIIRFDNNSSASGSMDLQDASASNTAALQGSFVFNVSGIDANGNDLQQVGVFSTDGTGTINGGVEDVNDDGTVSTNLAVSGSYSLGASGRGTATIITPNGAANYAFYVVDTNRLKLVEIDSVPIVAGDASRQQGNLSNASLNGGFAFTLGGRRGSNPLVAGGVFTADGNGNITSGVEDINSGSVSQNLTLTNSTYSIAGNGRGTLTLNNSSGAFHYVIYPSTGGLQMMEIDSAVLSSGTAYAQQGTGFSTGTLSGNFGFNLTGVNNGGEFDEIAQLAANGSGSWSGALDMNNNGGLSLGLAANGTYTLSGNGRGNASLSTSAGRMNFITYAVSSSRVLFIEADSTAPAVGSFEHQ